MRSNLSGGVTPSVSRYQLVKLLLKFAVICGSPVLRSDPRSTFAKETGYHVPASGAAGKSRKKVSGPALPRTRGSTIGVQCASTLIVTVLVRVTDHTSTAAWNAFFASSLNP